ncbi:MAG: M48 family metallopeptidase, partial [Deltaproteobacteria bacterium]|nr:M48 family metallopeptidase [Deltaproteobacteria bacterium]
DPAPNAMATGRDPEHALVAITTGLRTKLKRDELQAVIAHEIAHIKNSDTGLMMMVAVYAGLIVWVSDLGERLFLQKNCPGGRHQGGRSRGSGSALQLILFVVTLCLIWLAPIISKLLQLAISRQREYLADAAAVKYCRNPGALAEALKKISLDTDTPSRKNRALEHLYIINPDPKLRLERPDWDSLWSTHPPLIERIKRLRALEGQ